MSAIVWMRAGSHPCKSCRWSEPGGCRVEVMRRVQVHGLVADSIGCAGYVYEPGAAG